MELYSDEPFVSRNLDDFAQSAFRVDTGGDHTSFFIILPVFAVELIPVAVSLLNFFLSVSFISFGTFRLFTFVGSQTHGAILFGYIQL